MKKVIISISSLLVLAAVVVLFVNADFTKKDPKKSKAETEVAAKPACCSGEAKTAEAKPADAKAGCCETTEATAAKEGEAKPAVVAEKEACTPTAECPSTCPMKASAMK